MLDSSALRLPRTPITVAVAARLRTTSAVAVRQTLAFRDSEAARDRRPAGRGGMEGCTEGCAAGVGDACGRVERARVFIFAISKE
jgi:hypothetical protein